MLVLYCVGSFVILRCSFGEDGVAVQCVGEGLWFGWCAEFCGGVA